MYANETEQLKATIERLRAEIDRLRAGGCRFNCRTARQAELDGYARGYAVGRNDEEAN